MDHEINAFQELYVTDSPDPNVFVRLFSDYPVHEAHPLFRPGNVVLKGTQGSGKSMLLNLFRAQIRVAYHQAGIPFPVPEKQRNFISAGINLTKSGILDIGTRPVGVGESEEVQLFPLYFSDFLNYWIVRDLLDSVVLMSRHKEVFGSVITESRLARFAQRLSSEDCWFGALREVRSLEGLISRIDERIAGYRSFHTSNADKLPDVYSNTKTTVGEPVARCADCLKSEGVIPETMQVFVRIDQIERLSRSDIVRKELGTQYRRIINKAISTRDQRVSYKLGTRRYAWEDDLYIYQTGDRVENLRDYRIIDIDETLRRKEDDSTWIFPFFAADVFSRRILHAGYEGLDKSDPLGQVFGAGTSAKEEARQYAKNSRYDRALRVDKSWPQTWHTLLQDLFSENPLEAIHAAAWARQRGRGKATQSRLASAPPKNKPWRKKYWRKERVRIALMQLAARCSQRLKWCGKDSILALSGGNVSIFLSICHEVWEVFLRYYRREKYSDRKHPVRDGIKPELQAVGIHTASIEWLKKISELPNGDDRLLFISYLGRQFRSALLADEAMSYPGHNGFSLDNGELDDCLPLVRFLSDAVGFSDLYDAPHTTKRADRKPRTKWYLSPILSVHFQIPEAHNKEPYYATVPEVLAWLKAAGVVLEGIEEREWQKLKPKGLSKNSRGSAERLPLFDKG